MKENKFIGKGGARVKVIAIILIVTGVLGMLMGAMMYGDIGIAAFIGATSALFSGIGFFKLNKKLS